MRDVLLRVGMALRGIRLWRPLENMARDPRSAQHNVLRRIVAANAGTRFGAEHGFPAIRNIADFQKRVPVQRYETLRPYIEEQRSTGSTALTAEAPLFYAQTSGTTGVPKTLPITPTVLAVHRAEQALFSFLQHRACPAAFRGKAWGIMGAAVESRLDSGHTVGSVSGHLYRALPAPIRARFVVTPSVSEIADYELKYLVILRLALAEPDITYLGSPNPSTFLRLLDVLDARRDVLARSLETGRLEELDVLDAALRGSIAGRLRPARDRARSVAALGQASFSALWPNIRLLTTWTGGSCGIALQSLRSKLPSRTKVMELGYQSTEFRGTLALQPETAGGLPSLHHHVLEFVEQSRWDNGDTEFLTLDRLEPGKRYYVLVTTAAGLYRYFMNDLVEVAGRFHATPLLRFIQKGKGVTNLTGEKLYEAQAIEAVQTALSRYGLRSAFFILIADDERPAYRLYIEPDVSRRVEAAVIAADVDRSLGDLNMEYRAKRMSGRLAPLTLAWLRAGTAEASKAACIRAGQREGQYKAVALQYRKDCLLSFDDYIVPKVESNQ